MSPAADRRKQCRPAPPAAGGVGALVGLVARIWLLGIGAGVQLPGALALAGFYDAGGGRGGPVIDQLAAQPQAAQADDGAFAQHHGKGGEDLVGGDRSAALAAALLFLDAVFVALQPHHVAGHRAGSVHARDVGAVGGGGEAQLVRAGVVLGGALGGVDKTADGHADLG